MNITRRDFINGVAITVVAGMTPFQILKAAPNVAQQTLYYPPELTGLRGNHDGSFEGAHAIARSGKQYDYASVPVIEEYDLVIVGAGISGLSAAHFYRKQMGEDKKILLIDNHDDFGGHAKRNEFTTPDGMLLGYGGSESLQSPKSIYSKVSKSVLADLSVDVDKLGASFQRTFYPDLGLSRGVYFDSENFGVNKIVSGDPGRNVADDIPPDRLNGRSYAEFIGDFPLPEADRKALIVLHEETVDYLAGMSQSEKVDYLGSHSYTQFLRDKVKLSPLAIKFFQQRTNDFQAVGIDATSCSDARLCALPGFAALGLPPLEADEQAELDDPYIYHFPDGNASLARLLVRHLIPDVAPGHGMEDIVKATFDYAQLDKPGANTRLRLNAIGLHVENIADNQADVTYLHKNKDLQKVRAKKVIMAGYNMLIPYVVPSLPEAQKNALRENVKAPLVYTKVVIRNWQPFVKLGVHEIYSPAAPYSRVKLDYPVSMGGYEHPKTPDAPMCLHMVYVPTMPGSTLSAREQSRMGRATLLAMPFSEHEKMIRKQLQGMFGDAGFDHEKDILAITVNRWAHGYSYTVNSLFDKEDESEKIIKTARQPFGNIHIANSDSDWSPYAHSAMDQGWRAVQEITQSGAQGGEA